MWILQWASLPNQNPPVVLLKSKSLFHLGNKTSLLHSNTNKSQSNEKSSELSSFKEISHPPRNLVSPGSLTLFSRFAVKIETLSCPGTRLHPKIATLGDLWAALSLNCECSFGWMGLVCSCFGRGNGDHEPSPIFENLVNKCKSLLFHRGQVEAAAPGDEARTAVTDPLTVDDTDLDSQQNDRREVVKPPSQAFMQTGDNTLLHRKVVVQEALKTQAKEAKENKVCFPCSDDEDVCPTCLEEYDEENPKITTQCNHHYHLACIYEWMERSLSCPVCGTLMLFEQKN